MDHVQCVSVCCVWSLVLHVRYKVSARFDGKPFFSRSVSTTTVSLRGKNNRKIAYTFTKRRSAAASKRYSGVENETSKFDTHTHTHTQPNGIRKTICQRTNDGSARTNTSVGFHFSFHFFAFVPFLTFRYNYCIVAAKHYAIKINEFSSYNQHNVCVCVPRALKL